MKYIIKPFSEIIVKSKPVRKRYLNFLQTNCNLAIKKINKGYKVKNMWDKLELFIPDISIQEQQELIKILSRIPGIESFLEVEEYLLTSLDDIGDKCIDIYKEYIDGKTFVVRVKRTGIHDFTSIEAEKYIGAKILKKINKAKVKLKSPDFTLNIEIKNDKAFLVKNKYEGIGGYPVGTQDKVLSLISGGFDSAVSSYSMIKRGCKVDYLFFNLGGKAHESGVKQISNYIWNNFSSGYKAKFITVNFERIIEHITRDINHRYRAIILKRMFLRVADTLAKESEYYAIIKGDSLGQVSSQTLKNMFVIDKSSETMVLRPLISFNKQEIINISSKIGTYEYSCNMPEYCGVISNKPATGATEKQILEEEENFDFSLLTEALENKKVESIDNVIEIENDGEKEIEVVYIPGNNEVVIDIREEPIEEANPLKIENIQVLKIPFFDIMYDYEKLDQTKTYLLYCDKGIMSKNYGLNLIDKGFKNVKIFRPLVNDSLCKI